MPRAGCFGVSLPNRLRPRMDELTEVTGRSMAWVMEYLMMRVDIDELVDELVRGDAMVLVGGRGRRGAVEVTVEADGSP